jgi:phenylalanyl-tRNA synthetase beta chain
MPVVRLYYEDIEELVGASRDVIMSRLAMMGADIGKKAEEDHVDVEFFPDRPDLYCSEGVARALRGFLGIQTGLPEYHVAEGGIVLDVDKSVKSVRPIIGCAVVRNLEFNDAAIESLMDLQEDLHWGLGRNRRKVAIGVHDISSVTPPFRYLAVDPDRRFVPLDFAESLSMREILEKHPKGRDYGHILKGFDRYPLIVDANDDVLSFPPVINGELTRIKDDTCDLFIDVTGTDPVVYKALNIVVTALSERGGKIEGVCIRDPDGDKTTPDLRPASWTVQADEANRLIGFDLSPPELANCLEKMRFGAKAIGQSVQVLVPAYRADIMHSWDIFEDAAKGYGYENLAADLPDTVTTGLPNPVETLKADVRELLSGLGFLETMPFTLTNEIAHFQKMRRQPIGCTRVMHPISELHTILRTSILSGLLEILSLNQHHPLPQKIFAAGEVVYQGKTRTDFAAVTIHSSASFSEIRSIADSVLRELMIYAEIEPSTDGAFLPGRGADLMKGGKKIGCFGELHPLVVRSFGLEQPAVAIEMILGYLEGSP